MTTDTLTHLALRLMALYLAFLLGHRVAIRLAHTGHNLDAGIDHVIQVGACGVHQVYHTLWHIRVLQPGIGEDVASVNAKINEQSTEVKHGEPASFCDGKMGACTGAKVGQVSPTLSFAKA